MMGIIRKIVHFINDSAKRLTVFKAAVKYCKPNAMINTLKGLCDTRWVERHECIETFMKEIPLGGFLCLFLNLLFHHAATSHTILS